jgi:hypothetical protein
MPRLLGLGAFDFALTLFLLNAGPTWGQGSGNVTATVQVQAAACITINPNSFTYAPAPLSTSTAFSTTLPSSTKPSLSNCSTAPESFLARGGSATGAGATWTLETSFNCGVPQINMYRHEARPSGGSFFSLSTTDQTLETDVPASNSRTLDTRLTMPCTGSDGVGTTMTLPITITAVVQ